MNRYLDRFDRHLGHIEKKAREANDPHRSRILWNYLHHGAFEVSGEWEHIFTPEMTVPEPHYEMRTGTDETVVLDGEDAVKDFYRLIEEENVMAIDDGNHRLFVNDGGLAEFASTVEFVSGQEMLDDGLDKWFYSGVDVSDPDATYAKQCRHAMFWPYTEEAQLIGEMVYQIEPFEVTQLEPEEVPTLEEAAAVAEQYYPENVDGSTPFDPT